MKKYLAEAFGTATLTAIVILSVSSEYIIATPLAAGLTLLLFVYTIGSMTGAQINPAVTLGLMSIKKLPMKDGMMYIIYQIIGAAVALILCSYIDMIPKNIDPSFSWKILSGEIVGTLFFTFGIASIVYGKVSDTMSGVVIGGSLVMGILFAAYIGSNGILNPAVAFGIGSLGWAYVLGPIIGSIAGFNLYKFLRE